jgi:hypothetical protein
MSMSATRSRSVLALLAVLALLSVAGPEAQAQDTPTPTATATSTATPTVTNTPTQTAVPAETPPMNFLPQIRGTQPLEGSLLITVGKLFIGQGGAGISKSVRTLSTQDIASIDANSCLDTAINVTGAATGSECVVGLPASPTANLSFTCYVSATNQVKLRACNPTGSPINPASAAYSVRTFAP